MPIHDLASIAAAGLNPTKKMLKYGNLVDQYGNCVTRNPLSYNLDYGSLYDLMRDKNKIDVLERYMWTNMLPGLTQDLIERILFYRGKGVFYYNPDVEKFQFLPFGLNGLIDEYGRYTRVNTLPFTGVDRVKSADSKKMEKAIYEELEIVYDLPYTPEMLEKVRNSKKPVGIILNDSSLDVGQQPPIRSNMCKPILHLMATLMQIINTAMFGCADHNLVKVTTEGEYSSIVNQLSSINSDILHGERFTPIIGELPIETLKTNNTANLEGLFSTFNSLNNLLKSINGVANSGVFEKKAHLLQEEQDINDTNADDVYYNGLRLRQEACILIQAYYGYPIWCESKRAMSEKQEQDFAMGKTNNPDDTQRSSDIGGSANGKNNV